MFVLNDSAAVDHVDVESLTILEFEKPIDKTVGCPAVIFSGYFHFRFGCEALCNYSAYFYINYEKAFIIYQFIHV